MVSCLEANTQIDTYGYRCRRDKIADEEELVRQANDTHFGLAAGIWRRDIQRAHRVAHALKSGTVWVNY
jgi:delta 1-pyrroline-5-carboxylate dehydrogenase